MATVTDTDLKEIKDLIIDLKINQVRMEERLSGQINLLDEKVSGLDKRIENQEFTSRGILIGLIVVVLGGAAKVFGFLPNP